MLKLQGITQAAIDGTTRKVRRLPFVSQMMTEDATMMALLWLHENAEGFDPDPDPPLGLLYVCARFRAYRLRHRLQCLAYSARPTALRASSQLGK